jgi:hypothetical protein
MKRLGPQAKKLFEYTSDKKGTGIDEGKKIGVSKKYTFILPVELMKKVKHSAVEQDKTISLWLTEAIKKHLAL